MGACGCGDREGLHTTPEYEEALIKPIELGLGLSDRLAMEWLRKLFLISVNGEVSEARLRAFLKEMELEVSDLTDANKPMGRLFGEFRGQTGYQPEKVGLLIVLLGQATPEAKGEALFLLNDLDHNEFLSQAEMTSMITDVMDLALLHLPLYAADCLAQHRASTEVQRLKDYADLLGRKQKAAVELLVTQIMQGKGNLTALSFCASLKESGKALCSAEALRLFAQNPNSVGKPKK